MTTRLTISFIASLLLFSCVPEIDRVPEPKNLLSEEKMIEIMADLIKTESHITNENARVSDYFKMMINSGDEVLKSHNVTKKRLEGSLDYYASRQEMMTEIYDTMVSLIN